MTVKFVILGGGPAGVQAASWGARLGAEVTMIERDVIGGAANLWDCIPSKAMIATGGAMWFTRRTEGMGLHDAEVGLDLDALKVRISAIEAESADGAETLEADAILLSTGSRPRVPDWCEPDGHRILTTRDAYPPPDLPEHLVVIGSGVTGV